MKTQIKVFLIFICCWFATSLFAQVDPNETGVVDTWDFKECKVKFHSSGQSIIVEVIFYDTPNPSFNGWGLYFSTDNNNTRPEYAVHFASNFTLRGYKNGTVGPVLHTGTPVIYRNKCTVVLPTRDMKLDKGSIINYWFAHPAWGNSAKDRMPDSGTFGLKVQW